MKYKNLLLKNSLFNINCYIFSFLLLFAISFNAAASSNVQYPVVTLKSVTNKVLKKLRDNNVEIEKNPSKLYDIIYEDVVPHVDFSEISKWVAGKKAWRNSSGSQRSNFINQFRLIIVKTYASALNNYSEETVNFSKKKTKIRKRMQVSGTILDRNKNQNIKIDFRVILSNNTWKLYDIVVEGVSLLKGFQAQFSDLIRNEGLDVATKKMRKHNLENVEKKILENLKRKGYL